MDFFQGKVSGGLPLEKYVYLGTRGKISLAERILHVRDMFVLSTRYIYITV